MDSKNDLRRAEELIAEGRRIVRQQKGRVIRLRAAGMDTWDAERALRLFEANWRIGCKGRSSHASRKSAN